MNVLDVLKVCLFHNNNLFYFINYVLTKTVEAGFR